MSLAGASVQIPIIHYSDHKLAVTANAISTILFILLPTMSIHAMSFIQRPHAQMVAIIAFTFLFSVVLWVTVKARIECFLSTAAFATAQVFFVCGKR
jgi:hypothetical protein